MRIACLVPSISRNAGGAYESVLHLCQSLYSLPETEVQVLGMLDENTNHDQSSWAPLTTHIFAVQGPPQFGYAPGLKERLYDLDADILMTHGLWMYPTLVALAWHRRTGRPFLMNPHGMLDAWAINHSYWKKRIVAFLHEDSVLRKAACIRALCPSEAGSIRAYGLRNPICVIPNGVNQKDEHAVKPRPKGPKVLLYLGRIHPKKGLSQLLRAWAAARRRPGERDDWNLKIVGWSQGDHEQELKDLVQHLGISESVTFSGPLFGQAKTSAYYEADAFILPSFSEGLPMAVLEAWSHQLPVLITPQCNLPEGLQTGAALRVEVEIGSLTQGLETLFSMTDEARTLMGRLGRELVSKRFNWPQIGGQMNAVCQWLLGKAGPPACLLSNERNVALHEPSLV